MASINIPAYGAESWKESVDVAGSLPLTNNSVGDARVARNSGVIYVWDGFNWTSPSGSGTVTSVGLSDSSGLLTISGSPVTGAGTLTILSIQYASASLDGVLSSTDWNTFNNKQESISTNPSMFLGTNSSNVIGSIPGWDINAVGGKQENLTIDMDNTGGKTANTEYFAANPSVDSPNDSFTAENMFIDIDTNSDGFSLGTNGGAANVIVSNIRHHGTSDIGSLTIQSHNLDIGNGTDPISVGGVGYCFGFGTINDGVTINGPMQGYGYQLNISAGAVAGTNSYTQAFYDASNIGISVPGYTSIALGSTIAGIKNNSNYTGLNMNTGITELEGNANYTGIAINPNIGTIGSGIFQGLQVSPTITDINYAAGLNISMDNVTVLPGAAAFLVIQDLTLTVNQVGTGGNAVTVEYTGGGTAGSEVVSNIGLAITVQIQNGVSTASQIKTALDGFAFTATNLTTAVSGVGSNPQSTQAVTSFAGGIDAGRKQAAYLDGDVEITGALTFGGSLSIGKLQAFASQTLSNGGGNPQSIHQLITAPSCPANSTIINADLLGVNTAMLLDIGNNSTVTTSFLGISALGLPAVVKVGATASVDKVSGAVFALSLDSGGGAGGSIDQLDLCRAIAIPNGITAVNKLTGYRMDLPFGDPGTQTWGTYITPDVPNYMAGSVVVGTSDTPTNDSVGIELNSTTKAILSSRMTTAERDALTAVNGMVLYNTTTDKLQVYAAGSWVDLH